MLRSHTADRTLNHLESDDYFDIVGKRRIENRNDVDNEPQTTKLLARLLSFVTNARVLYTNNYIKKNLYEIIFLSLIFFFVNYKSLARD